MASRSRIELESWLKTIDVKGSVLDIGGSQNTIQGRTKSWDVSEYVIMDLETPHECKQKPDIIEDIQEISWWDEEADCYVTTSRLDSYKENSFSGIKGFDNVFCIEVSEYWNKPFDALIGINQLMKKGGTLYISFHTLYGLHNPKGEDCLRYTKNAIEKLMKETGFKILEMIPRTISKEGRCFLEQFYRTEGMRLDYSDPETWVEGYLVKTRKI